VKKNYVVKSNYVYDVFGGARWTFEQKRATRYAREEAIARVEYLRPVYGKRVRVVKLVPKKVVMNKNYVVKSGDKYDDFGPSWMIHQKDAARYTRTQAYARVKAIGPYSVPRVVKLVSKKVAPVAPAAPAAPAAWVIRRRDPIQYRSRAAAIEAIGFMRGALKDWKVVKVRP
jgi:hypothetical protein